MRVMPTGAGIEVGSDTPAGLGAGGILQHHDVPVGLGRYPIVTLAEARTKALENARAVD